jgi:hypothetical protein
MSRRVLVGFITVNILVTLAVVAIFVSVYQNYWRPEEPGEGPTQIVILTATPLPGVVLQPSEYQGTIDAQQLTLGAMQQAGPQVSVITATPRGEEGIEVPDVTAVATIDPALLPPIPTDLPPGQPSPTPQNDGCIRHVVESGDVIITIAQQYGVFPGDVLLANDLDENAILHIGDVLLIPVEGCNILNTPTPAPTASNTPFSLTRVAPTVTLPPTAVNAQVEIADVVFWGEVNSEAVELRNLGNVINLQGWTLSNVAGETFLFPEFRMQQGSRVRVFSRQGQNTPAALYWNRERPAWADGDVVTLRDSTGQLQATFRIGQDEPLFQEATQSP